MNRLSDKKLQILQQGVKSNNDYWYVTKQECSFSNLCYIAEILSRWGSNVHENYEDFFNRTKSTPEFYKYIGKTAHRATINLTIYGLKRKANGYFPTDLTPVFWKIRAITKGKYCDTTLYQNIIDDQLEKIFVTTSSIAIYPMMFTFKIILTLGDITGDYSITKDEFKTFVSTAHKWNEFFMSVESILRYRNDSDYRLSIAQSQGKKQADDTRFNLVIANHSLIKVKDNTIFIPKECVNDVRLKLAKYELSNPTEIDVDDAVNRLESNTLFSPKQIIFFGAPGVGKSHYLKSLYSREDDMFRVTFHPDSDYSSFVGCYKPFMADEKSSEISYGFQPQAFTDAYVSAWASFVGKTERRDIFLFIEEINRGNCAQIFGDIFQLLDRDDMGMSDYTIRPDKDLEAHLKTAFSDIKDKLNGIVPGIGDGSKLCLPPNFNILATMNTSDQSLFPIDSAFKRRWDWVYMPIVTEPKSGDTVIKRNIVTDNYSYDWGEFLEKVNARILTTTQSEDKQLGFWFVKPKSHNASISANDFVSKVIFFLWNDIYKDFGEDSTSIFNFADDGNPAGNSKKRHSFRDFTKSFNMVDNALVEAFLRNLNVTANSPVMLVQSESSVDSSTDENSN